MMCCYDSGEYLPNKTMERGRAEYTFKQTNLHPFSKLFVINSVHGPMFMLEYGA